MKVMVEEDVLLESKAKVEDYATDIKNYGSKAVVFTMGKGAMFQEADCRICVSFQDCQREKEFKVGKNEFDRSHEGQRGRLSYMKDKFVAFSTKNP